MRGLCGIALPRYGHRFAVLQKARSGMEVVGADIADGPRRKTGQQIVIVFCLPMRGEAFRIAAIKCDGDGDAAGSGQREANDARAARRRHPCDDARTISNFIIARMRLFAALQHRRERPCPGIVERYANIASRTVAPDPNAPSMRKAGQLGCRKIIAGMIGGAGVGTQLNHAIGRDRGRAELSEICQRADERIDQHPKLAGMGGRGCQAGCKRRRPDDPAAQGKYTAHGSSGSSASTWNAAASGVKRSVN